MGVKFYMAQNQGIEALMAALRKTTYFRWMAKQGVPVIDGYGVEDVREVATNRWARTVTSLQCVVRPIDSHAAYRLRCP